MDGTLMAYVGTDPDAQVNMFHYDGALAKYTITKELYNPEYPCHQGPVHDGQFHPTGIKYECKTREACSDFTGSQHFNGLLPKEGEELVPI
jgi:hypothetical protein